MNPFPDSHSPDDPLDRATAALRETPVPPGPPEATASRTLAALQSTVPGNLPLRRPRWRVATKAAAALLLIVGGLFYAGGLFRVGTPLAFADVARKFHDARTLAYQMTMRSPEVKEALTLQVFLKEPGRIRMESSVGQVIVGRLQGEQFKMLTLIPALKTAILVDVKNLNRSAASEQFVPLDLVRKLRRLVEKEGRPAGIKQIGNVRTRGFRVQEGPVKWVVWADPETRLPVQVDAEFKGARVTLGEFRFNPRLDDALFAMKVPKGYKLEPMEVEILPPEEALVQLLKAYAAKAGDQFPERLDDPAVFARHLERKQGTREKKEPSPEAMRLIVNAGQVTAFIQVTLKGRYGYRPAGVRRGDADKMLFWYRPADSSKYRVLYGDLHWADVTTDLLPEVPKP